MKSDEFSAVAYIFSNGRLNFRGLILSSAPENKVAGDRSLPSPQVVRTYYWQLYHSLLNTF